jgi:hypothetical protein
MGGMSLIKIVFCLARLPALSVEEFHAYWRDQHAPLVREAAPLLRIRRYTQSRYFSDPRIDPAVDARGCKVGPLDTVEDIIAAGSTREGRAAGRGLLADEKNFIDLPNSAHFFTREDVIIAS